MIKAPDEHYQRYSQRPLPPYRFVLGENPHPTEESQGHSYRHGAEDPGIIKPDKWYENETYQYGVDLLTMHFGGNPMRLLKVFGKKFPKMV